MELVKPSLILLLGIAFGSCMPSPDETTPTPRIYDDITFKANVSRLIGDGGKTQNTCLGVLASNIVWKDSTGSNHDLQELRGNVVLLNMWATWCGPCREEMPDLQEIATTYAPDGLRVIGVSIDRAREPFRSVFEFARDYGINYQLILDSSATAHLNYGGNGDIPWTYIIDRDGYIQYSFDGQASKDQLVEAIEAIL